MLLFNCPEYFEDNLTHIREYFSHHPSVKKNHSYDFKNLLTKVYSIVFYNVITIVYLKGFTL